MAQKISENMAKSYSVVAAKWIHFQDTSVGVCLRSLTSHSQPVMQIRWSGERPDLGGVVYSAGRDCVIKVWNPKDGAMLSPGMPWSLGMAFHGANLGIGGKL